MATGIQKPGSGKGPLNAGAFVQWRALGTRMVFPPFDQFVTWMLAASTVRAIDLRYLERWAQGRRRPALRQMGVDEIYLGKSQKFLTVVTNLETGEPLWFGRERKRETLDEFFEKQLSAFQRSAIRAACVDMWEPFRQSLERWVPECRIVYDKFHILQHASQGSAAS